MEWDELVLGGDGVERNRQNHRSTFCQPPTSEQVTSLFHASGGRKLNCVSSWRHTADPFFPGWSQCWTPPQQSQANAGSEPLRGDQKQRDPAYDNARSKRRLVRHKPSDVRPHQDQVRRLSSSSFTSKLS